MSRLLFIILVCLSGSLVAQDLRELSDEEKKFSILFEDRDQDFGEVKKGEIKETTFKFENNGTEDIKIELVSGCECTTLDWPRKVIRPGEKGEISAIFDSSKKEASETVEIDINFENIDPESGYNRFEIVSYKFVLIP
ncbi:MAG: DUF1573 domain-containing protein [Saprospiraceae bacterium]|nr:DUF1573 domain-containing protein [Bacteroidia bacterium]NNL90885.1 DUF1573 domain-containing protein [Saprospiraceae bacterium]